jgi:DNA invertase Pin-like site-specific DNA recombinase
MVIGYARISTVQQNLDLQIDALKKFDCEVIYTEKMSGSIQTRPELDAMLAKLRKGDVVVIWKLDRLGRNLKHIIELVNKFNEMGVVLKSVQDSIDTSTINGRLFLNIMGSLAEFERELIRERTIAGLQSARARGRLGGRPKGYSRDTISKIKSLRVLAADYSQKPDDICRSMHLTRPTYYRYVKIANTFTDKELDGMILKK